MASDDTKKIKCIKNYEAKHINKGPEYSFKNSLKQFGRQLINKPDQPWMNC